MFDEQESESFKILRRLVPLLSVRNGSKNESPGDACRNVIGERCHWETTHGLGLHNSLCQVRCWMLDVGRAFRQSTLFPFSPSYDCSARLSVGPVVSFLQPPTSHPKLDER